MDWLLRFHASFLVRFFRPSPLTPAGTWRTWRFPSGGEGYLPCSLHLRYTSVVSHSSTNGPTVFILLHVHATGWSAAGRCLLLARAAACNQHPNRQAGFESPLHPLQSKATTARLPLAPSTRSCVVSLPRLARTARGGALGLEPARRSARFARSARRVHVVGAYAVVLCQAGRARRDGTHGVPRNADVIVAAANRHLVVAAILGPPSEPFLTRCAGLRLSVCL